MSDIRAGCCVVGGGPAGMMAAMLFARAGVSTVLLEKHADFLRDFRGDTIHPSTLEVMDELGVLESFLTASASRSHDADGKSRRYARSPWPTSRNFRLAASSSRSCRSGTFSISWRKKRSAFQSFDLRMQARAEELIWENGRVAGVRAQTPAGPLNVRSDLTIAADGRESMLRPQAGLDVVELGAPMDVLWLRLTQTPERSAPDLRLYSGWPHHGADRPWRLLAMRLRHSEGDARRAAPARLGRVSRVKSARSCRSWPIASASSQAGTTSSC